MSRNVDDLYTDALTHVASLLRTSLSALDHLIDQGQRSNPVLCEDARYFRRKLAALLDGDSGIRELITRVEKQGE